MSYSTYEVRRGAYYDSVVLMQLQKALVALDGVTDAGAVMATPANRELLQASGFALDGIEAKADDLLIVVRGEEETAVSHAIAQIDALFKKRQSGGTGSYRPKTVRAAAQMEPEANWVLVSVPGRYAADVAEQALDLGKHVFLYSDNVTIEQEMKLKQKAQSLGLLVMGPDCGTAVINNIGFGFANRVSAGNIGLIAASGTGLQLVTTAIDALGGGVSQAIGTGGRDLKEAVGGITMLQSLDLLARDPATDVIVLISKPPAPAVAATLLQKAHRCAKPVVVCFLGYAPPAKRLGKLHFAAGLEEAAEIAVRLEEKSVNSEQSTVDSERLTSLASQSPAPNPQSPVPSDIRGLFSGGTLALELYLGLRPFLPTIQANIATDPSQQMDDVWQSSGHTLVDLGEDAFTQGRLHPMMDNDLRIRRLRQELADAATGLIVLDVVLGDGAHSNPANELAPVIAEGMQQNSNIQVAVLLVGTAQDPQNVDEQSQQLTDAGAVVFRSTSALVDAIVSALPFEDSEEDTPVPLAHFSGKTAVLNVGLESFYDDVRAQGITAVHVDWRPPAGGNEKMMALLAKMKQN